MEKSEHLPPQLGPTAVDQSLDLNNRGLTPGDVRAVGLYAVGLSLGWR